MREAAAIIITGAPPAFCSGHDLKELAEHRQDPDRGRAFFEQTMQSCSALMRSIVCLPQPGDRGRERRRDGGGLPLAASCDLAVAGESAEFATPGVNIGLFCSTPMVALSRILRAKLRWRCCFLAKWFLRRRRKTRPCELGRARHGRAFSRHRGGGQNREQVAFTLAIGKKAFYRQADMPLPRPMITRPAPWWKICWPTTPKRALRLSWEKRKPLWTGF